ncbi:VCBS repeat-containing protein [Jiulongibacter sp. NS-SX5]|uniref:VCBS repeat-containing protein n=1 Tax=Jiulongibacter sp. NS-SX5 TaxID=3463854 RepID=UPI004057D55A
MACKKESKTLFTKVSSDHSSIYFSNQITENDQYNVYDFHNLYNGGGVAVIDINNDGLQDLYFAGNQVYDKLYLNKGNFVFEDISKSAGIQSRDWSTGVSVVDINKDGLLDLYVCKSGNESSETRANHLYINNGDLTFSEEALKYGIADTTETTHSAFFDFDKDGDLDLYLLTTSNKLRNPNLLHPKERYGLYTRDRLYINDGTGYFTEEGLQRGITENNHGLGLAISDLNQDGWLDIVASSDFLPNDIVYLNNQDGSFSNRTNEILPYQSRFSMGNDVADINNDGLPDLMTVDMLPSTNEQQKKMLMTSYHVFETELKLNYAPEFTRNMLFINNGIYQGLPQYSEQGYYAGVSSTDWSWAPLMVDFDNDGLKDIAVNNGYLRDVTDSDFISYNLSFADNTKSKEELRAFMNSNAAKLPHLEAKNMFFKQTDDLSFDQVTDQWISQEPGFSGGVAVADLDNDGDFDYVINNINEPAGIYKNNSTRNYLKINLLTLGNIPDLLGTTLKFETSTNSQSLYYNQVRGYLSSIDPSLIFGLGDQKTGILTIDWPDGKQSRIENVAANQTLNISYEDLDKIDIETPSNTSNFRLKNTEINHRENRFIDFYSENLLLQKYSNSGPAIAIADLNKDDIDEVFLGGNSDFNSKLYKQSSNGSFEIVWERECNGEVADAEFFDANGDGLLDLYLLKGSNEFLGQSEKYQDELLINIGHGNFEQRTAPTTTEPGSKILIADFDNDGDLDLFRFGAVRPSDFPNSSKTVLFINDGQGNFQTEGIFDLGIVRDAVSSDYDKDGDLDILLVGHFFAPIVLVNTDGKFEEKNLNSDLSGLWETIHASDLDGDGDLDYLLGNIGLNYRYPFSPKHPITIHGSKTNKGFVMSYYKNNGQTPIATRDDLIRQFPKLKNQFPNYSSYALASMIQLQNEFPITIREAKTMESGILWNNKGKLEFDALPQAAQRLSIFDFQTRNINNDELPDIIIAGNNYQLEPTNSGYIEGSLGTVLLNKGNKSFTVLTNQKSGLYLKGQTKELREIRTKKGSEILAARQNNSALRISQSH